MIKDQILRPVLSGLSAFASLAGGVLFVAPEAADAQGSQPSQGELASTVRRFDIAPGPFSDVVGAFRRVTGIQVTLAIDSIGSIQSPGISGSFTAEQALQAMVARTGIRFRVTSPTGAVLELAPGPSPCRSPAAIMRCRSPLISIAFPTHCKAHRKPSLSSRK